MATESNIQVENDRDGGIVFSLVIPAEAGISAFTLLA